MSSSPVEIRPFVNRLGFGKWEITAFLIGFLCLSSVCFAKDPGARNDAASKWTRATETNRVVIYSRIPPGSPFKEFKAVGEIAASSDAIHEVLNDTAAYPSFMPYVTECRVLKREGDSHLVYQRISPPLCSDRDYTIRIHETERPAAAGIRYLSLWKLANASGPKKKPGVIRVALSEGSWLLEPIENNKTRATYSIHTDSGGTLPAFLANHANQLGIGRLFSAVRKQVRKPKYSMSR